MGKKHYNDAIDCYTRAIDQKALSESDNSVIFSNRAHVNLLLGNYRRALTDAQEAIRLCPTNVKVPFSLFEFWTLLNFCSCHPKLHEWILTRHCIELLKRLWLWIYCLKQNPIARMDLHTTQITKNWRNFWDRLICKSLNLNSERFKFPAPLQKLRLDNWSLWCYVLFSYFGLLIFLCSKLYRIFFQRLKVEAIRLGKQCFENLLD